MMPVWQLLSAEGVGEPCWKAQSVRKDGHRADLVAYDDGRWFVNDLCDGPEVTVAQGRANDIEAAKLVARLVWELSG